MKPTQKRAIERARSQQIAQRQTRADLELAARNGNVRAQEMVRRLYGADTREEDRD